MDTATAQFTKDGFCILKNALPTAMLHRLRSMSMQWIEDALRAHTNRASRKNDAIVRNNNTDFVLNISDLFELEVDIFLELLAPLQSTADTLCGDVALVANEVMVVKTKGDDSEVLWHQDLITNHPTRSLQVGIYLDAADSDSGAIRFMPATHHEKQHICDLILQVSEDPSLIETISASAGDIIIHDSMLVHSSGILLNGDFRRVLYFGYRSLSQMVDEEQWDNNWIQERIKLTSAIREWKPGNEPCKFPNLYKWHVRNRAGNFCLPG